MNVMVTIGREIWLTALEAAAVLEVNPDHVRYLRRVGTLAGRNDSGVWLVLRSDVLRYQAVRGPWRPGGVVGGRAAQRRLGLERERGAGCR